MKFEWNLKDSVLEKNWTICDDNKVNFFWNESKYIYVDWSDKRNLEGVINFRIEKYVELKNSLWEKLYLSFIKSNNFVLKWEKYVFVEYKYNLLSNKVFYWIINKKLELITDLYAFTENWEKYRITWIEHDDDIGNIIIAKRDGRIYWVKLDIQTLNILEFISKDDYDAHTYMWQIF